MSAGRIFYYLLAALIVGIAIGSFIESLFFMYSAGCLALVCMYFISRNNLLCALFCTIGIIFGIISAQFALMHAEEAHASFTTTIPMQFDGTVSRIQLIGNRAVLSVANDTGALRITTFQRDIREGDRIKGVCESIEEPFSLSHYVSQRIGTECTHATITSVTSSQNTSAIDSIRKNLLGKIFRALPSPEAELLQGLLLGKQASLPPDFEESLRRTGTTHIVVLSGFNITVIAFVIQKLFRRFRMGLAACTCAGIVCIWLFVLLAGFTPPTMRAAIMVSVVLLATMRGRPHGAIRALLFSAAVLLIADPLLLRWSLSFQLSFLATLGVLFQEQFVPRFAFLPETFSIRDNTRTTFAATLMTLPLIVLTFGKISLVALLTNALILSLVPIAMGAGVLLLVASVISPSAGLAVGAISFVCLRFMTFSIETFSTLTFAYQETSQLVAIPAVVIIGLLFWKIRKKNEMNDDSVQKKSLVLRNRIAVIAIVSIAIYFVFYHPAQNVISFFDVGQGDSLLLQNLDGASVLVDAGPDDAVVSRLGRALTYFDRTIDVFVLSHPHADHITGFFSIAEKYHIKEVWFQGAKFDSPLYEEFFRVVQEKNILLRTVHEGTSINVGSMTFDVLWPPANFDSSDVNQTSLVIRADISNHSVLLMGDAGLPAESELLTRQKEEIPAEILKVGHHGSKSASSEDFLQTIKPKIAVISAGKDNMFGHPHQLALSRLENTVQHIFRTDNCGNVIIFFHEPLEVKSGC